MTTAVEPQSATQAARRQMRRAWLSLLAGLIVFIGIAAAIAGAGIFYFQHATQPETATLSIVSGSGALIRSPGDHDFRLITGTTNVSEGDEISTTLGTVLWVTLFDGSTVEIAEDTVLTVERMRSSRFLDSTKHVVLQPQRGTIYVAMAPRGEFTYSELTVETNTASVTMADGNGASGVGSFLVEVRAFETGPDNRAGGEATRAAVLRGTAMLEALDYQRQLTEDQQVLIDANGNIGEVTPAVRQLIVDGAFDFGLSNWVEFHDAANDEGVPTTAGAVELVTESVNGENVVAVEFLRGPGDQYPAQTGIRQRIGQTLRVYSSVRLEFDINIAAQSPPGAGDDMTQFPLVVEMNYVDVMGEERQWIRRFYAMADPDQPIPNDIASQVTLNQWTHVIFELHNLSPLPRQITSVVLYASGQSYQTMVTNLSLTSSELGQTGQ